MQLVVEELQLVVVELELVGIVDTPNGDCCLDGNLGTRYIHPDSRQDLNNYIESKINWITVIP